MCDNHLDVSLGFAEETVPVGTHLCIIFTDEEERKNSLLKFLLSGMKSGERAACFSNKIDEDSIDLFFEQNEMSYSDKKKDQAISLFGASEVYFQDGEFDPDRMLNTLSHFYKESIEKGFTASRVIGEMIPEIEHVKGGERLLEYESRVTMQLRDEPVTSVCQYDANLFSGSTIMEVLKVHPKMIVNGSVVVNPFFVEPEKYLNKKS